MPRSDGQFWNEVQRARAIMFSAVKRLQAGDLTERDYWLEVRRAYRMEIAAIERFQLGVTDDLAA